MKEFIYHLFFFLSYLGHPIILLFTYIFLFSLKVFEEINSKRYLPKNNLKTYIGIYTIIVFGFLPLIAHQAKDSMYRERVINILNNTNKNSKVYINNILIKDINEKEKIILNLKELKYIKNHHSHTTKNKINILIKEQEFFLNLLLVQDSTNKSEFWIYGTYETSEIKETYGHFSSVIDRKILQKYIKMELMQR